MGALTQSIQPNQLKLFCLFLVVVVVVVVVVVICGRCRFLHTSMPDAHSFKGRLLCSFSFLFSFFRGDGSVDAAASQLSEDDIRDLGNILGGFSKADFHHFGKVRPAFYFFGNTKANNSSTDFLVKLTSLGFHKLCIVHRRFYVLRQFVLYNQPKCLVFLC